MHTDEVSGHVFAATGLRTRPLRGRVALPHGSRGWPRTLPRASPRRPRDPGSAGLMGRGASVFIRVGFFRLSQADNQVLFLGSRPSSRLTLPEGPKSKRGFPQICVDAFFRARARINGIHRMKMKTDPSSHRVKLKDFSFGPQITGRPRPFLPVGSNSGLPTGRGRSHPTGQ